MSLASLDNTRYLDDLPVLRGVLGVTWFCFALAVITTGTRLYTRIYILRQFGLDDALLLPAMVMISSSMGLVHVLHREHDEILRLMIREGNDPATLVRLLVKLVLPLKLQYVLSAMYPVGMSPYHAYIYVCAAAMAMLAVAVFLATIFQCTPVQRAWEPLNAKCTNTDTPTLGVVVNAFSLLTDLILLLLPVPVVLHLRTDTKKKLALILLFSMGIVGTAVTALRLWKMLVLLQLYDTQAGSVLWWVEVTYVALLSQIEVAILVVCANLPSLAAWLKRSMGSHRSGSGPSGGGSGGRNAAAQRRDGGGGGDRAIVTIGGSGGRRVRRPGDADCEGDIDGDGGDGGDGGAGGSSAGGGEALGGDGIGGKGGGGTDRGSIGGGSGSSSNGGKRAPHQSFVYRLSSALGRRQQQQQQHDHHHHNYHPYPHHNHHRHQHLSLPERLFSRSAQGASTACGGGESVENLALDTFAAHADDDRGLDSRSHGASRGGGATVG